MPERIQLSRRKGYRKPEGAVVVARPSKWGNPFRVERTGNSEFLPRGAWYVDDGVGVEFFPTREDAARYAVEVYTSELRRGEYGPDLADVWAELEGKDLACWCPLDQPCHADVLLELANGGAE